MSGYGLKPLIVLQQSPHTPLDLGVRVYSLLTVLTAPEGVPSPQVLLL